MSARRAGALALGVLLAAGAFPGAARGADSTIVVGSKAFPESWILGEAMARLVRDAGGAAVHRGNLGGTEIVWAALRAGALDAYPEYTGTIAEVILKSPGRPSLEELRAGLAPHGVAISAPLGFDDGYALAVTSATRDRLGLSRLSDLARHPELRLGLTHEFLGRRDGWPGLAERYGLAMPRVRGIQHELAYEAIASGAVDVIDIYTTDAQIERLGLVTLEDDRGFFPRYEAVILYRAALVHEAPAALAALRRLEGAIDEPRMIRANAAVVLEKREPAAAAAALLGEAGLAGAGARVARRDVARELGRNLLRHVELVAIALAAAVLVGVPLGVLAARVPALAGATLAVTGVLQTIPSLALLAFLIPLLGVGPRPALAALFLYSLLPIVRNTFVGLTTIPPALEESARALGLSARTHLLRVSLPMASPAILAGIKISAVLCVGTATLAALIGAGGLGDPILAGIQLRRHDLILEGAIPAAALALVVQWGFDALDHWLIPRGLRLQSPAAADAPRPAAEGGRS